MGHRYWFVIGWVILLLVTILSGPPCCLQPIPMRTALSEHHTSWRVQDFMITEHCMPAPQGGGGGWVSSFEMRTALCKWHAASDVVKWESQPFPLELLDELILLDDRHAQQVCLHCGLFILIRRAGESVSQNLTYNTRRHQVPLLGSQADQRIQLQVSLHMQTCVGSSNDRSQYAHPTRMPYDRECPMRPLHMQASLKYPLLWTRDRSGHREARFCMRRQA